MSRIVLSRLVDGLVLRRALMLAAIFVWLAGHASTLPAQTSFYDAPKSLLTGEPGTLVRQELVDGAPLGAAAYRVLYRSTGLKGEPIFVSGVVVVPRGEPPVDGRPIIAWAHPTSGITPRCAPSLAMFVFQQIQGLRSFVERGYVVAATDYPGLGTGEPHPYLVGESEARAVIDAVRVARTMPGAGGGKRFTVWGHSQGGQAALFTGMIAKTYAPELTLLGVAAAAPATDLVTLMNDDINSAGGKNITAMTLWSWHRVYDVPIDGIVDPRAMSAVANRALAMAVARARAKRELRKISVVGRGAASVADRLVLRRLRRTFGSNLRYFVSGSAPMPVWLLEWFDGIGLPVFEAYGISENIVPMAMNRPGNSRLGTVGMPLPGQEVRLGADREILVRGPGVFRGYLTASGEVASGRDSADFWATGDYGELDADGFLRVIGRKSEVFKLSNGRWIAPAGIEALLRKVPYVEHAIALGAGRDVVVAFLALDPARFRIRQEALSASARAGDRDEVVRQDVLAATEALPAFQRPAGVLVTTDRFTVEGGELTSNLKLRRMTVETKYATEIGKFFVTLEARRQSARDGITAGTASPTVRWL